jgi:hypothetical protein
MLLSLVVIFTQSIQLSKIVERITLLLYRIAPLGGLSIPAQGSISIQAETQPQADIAWQNMKPCSRSMVELNGIEPLTPCLQSRCSPN